MIVTRPGRAADVTLAVARDRIERLEGDLRAWAWLDLSQEGGAAGELAGWPVGVKDLLDVRGMPTTGGGRQRDAEPAERDAPAVARLRAAGAALIGKTEAVEYGWFGTVRSRNPWNLERSPGGSSSGSAAAVAAAMCRAAVGTQTAGSVIRPGAYTGVVAMKLSHGAVEDEGLVSVSPTLDVLGAFARTVDDVAAMTAVLIAPERRGAQPDPVPGSGAALRIGVIEDHFGALTEPAVLEVFHRALGTVADAGLQVETVALPVDWTAAAAAHRTIMAREMARARWEVYQAAPDSFSPLLQEAIAAGAAIADPDYDAALQVREELRTALSAAASAVDAWVTPAATSDAPPAGQPGDPACNVAFSLVGFPALQVPAGLTGRRLPAGLQLVAGLGHELQLVEVGRAIERALPSIDIEAGAHGR